MEKACNYRRDEGASRGRESGRRGQAPKEEESVIHSRCFPAGDSNEAGPPGKRSSRSRHLSIVLALVRRLIILGRQ